jgi:hypothetical protein
MSGEGSVEAPAPTVPYAAADPVARLTWWIVPPERPTRALPRVGFATGFVVTIPPRFVEQVGFISGTGRSTSVKARRSPNRAGDEDQRRATGDSVIVPGVTTALYAGVPGKAS